jgi:hypothetical protein
MKERSISELEVMECLGGWTNQYTDRKGNPIYKMSVGSGRGIKVVVSKEDHDFVITVADY